MCLALWTVPNPNQYWPGVSLITIAYAQNGAWSVRTPLLTQTLGFIKTNHAKSDPCVQTFWRRKSDGGDVRWWTEASLLIHFNIYIKTNSFSCARATNLFHTNVLIEKYIKQLTANYVQIPLNSGVTEPSHWQFLIISSKTVRVSSNCCSERHCAIRRTEHTGHHLQEMKKNYSLSK